MISNEIDTQLEILENRTYKTYLIRANSQKRLHRLSSAWNTGLVSVSVAAAIGSIALLKHQTIFAEEGDLIFTILSIVILVVSLVITNQKYDLRSASMFKNYREIQKLSTDIEAKRSTGFSSDSEAEQILVEFNEKYQVLLDQVENHTKADYLLYLLECKKKSDRNQSTESIHRDTNTVKHLKAGDHVLITLSRVGTCYPFLLTVIPIIVIVWAWMGVF